MDLNPADILLCEFYFSDLKTSKHRPVTVFKDNLPFDDFVGIPVSSQITQLHKDEFILEPSDLASGIAQTLKGHGWQTFVISRRVIVKSMASCQRIDSSDCVRTFVASSDAVNP